jgi:hypothetical protein
MANEIQIDLSEWNKFALNLEKGGKLLDKHMRNAMDGSLALAIDILASETPIGVSGNLRGAWASEIYGEAFGMTGLAVNPLPYGLPVDQGRIAVPYPSREAITAISLWVKRKGLETEPSKVAAAAWAIARSPTVGAHMTDKTYVRLVSGTEIDQIWAYELEQFIGALTK